MAARAVLLTLVLAAACRGHSLAATISGSFTSIAPGTDVNLTTLGKLDWIQWGLGGDYRLNRKSSVTPLISNFTVISRNPTNDPLSFSQAYWFEDTNSSSCSWNDGCPVVAITNNFTRVLAYSYPFVGGSGFGFEVAADTKTNILSVYVGTIGARGEFKATLGGQSYTDSQPTTDINGVYTVAFAANSPGQTLAITWTLPLSTTIGKATLQAAALTALGADNPPFAILSSPAYDSIFAGPTNVVLSASAQDFDGTVTNVAFHANSNKLGQTAAGPYDFTWNGAPIGHHSLTAVATDNAGVSRSSLPVEIFVYGTGGTQAGSVAFPPSAVDLTAEGTSDWVHWGLSSSTSVDRKSGVAAQISNFTELGSAAVQRYDDNHTAFSWSDGTPTSAVGGTPTGVFVIGVSNGFYLTAPADVDARQLRVYVGAYAAHGHFLAYLSDLSAAPYIDNSIFDTNWQNQYGVYSINYRAASAGQQLIVVYQSSELLDDLYGNVTLQSATLQGGVLPVYILNSMRVGGDFIMSFNTQSGRDYTVEYTDGLTPAAWSNLLTLPGNGTMLWTTNYSVPPGRRFYRVRTQ